MPDRLINPQSWLVGFAAMFAATAPVLAQDIKDLVTIEDQVWGFDGRVHVGQFNPVSFLIDNRTEEPIDVTATLSRTTGMARATGGRIEQSVYIGAHARRWVQFYPYIESANPSEWHLRLGRLEFDEQLQPRSTASIPGVESKNSAPVVVILDPPGSLERQPNTVKHFPEDIFPPWGSATVGLHTVFMDHVPDWEEPRQAALISWLRRGGQLYLLKGGRGDWPEFSGTLSELSQPLDQFHVGSGLVRRLDIPRREITKSIVDSATGRDRPVDPDQQLDDMVNGQSAGNYGGYGYDGPEWMDEGWFQQLRQLTLPRHAWWLIFLLALIYIGLIFPGGWILSKQNRSFLVVYGAIAGVAVVFSVLFLLIGRRGYGEATTLHTLAISRAEGATQQSVLEWNALFVTSGDQYTVSAPDEQTLFAIPGQRERSNAVIREGDSGELSVAIPPFSTQTFVCRRQRASEDWELRVTDVQFSSSGLSRLTVKCGPGFERTHPQTIVVLYGNQLYRARFDPDSQSIETRGSRGSLTRYASEYQGNSYYMGYGWGYSGNSTNGTFYDRVMPGLVLRSLSADGTESPDRFRLPADRVRLFVYADYPEGQHLQISVNAEETGRILYVRDIILHAAGAEAPADTAPSE